MAVRFDEPLTVVRLDKFANDLPRLLKGLKVVQVEALITPDDPPWGRGSKYPFNKPEIARNPTAALHTHPGQRPLRQRTVGHLQLRSGLPGGPNR